MIALLHSAIDLSLKLRWQSWNIDLATINTNLGSVTSLAIGVQGPGATGTLLLDDIRLYPYAREIITPVQPDPAGLVLHYAFEGNTNDSAGANPGLAVGGPIYLQGKIGQAISFDGLSQYVNCGEDTGAGITADFTLAAWVQMTPGNAGQTNYAASKAGIIGFTKSLAKEVGSRSITVNAVAPGFVPTTLTEVLSEDLKQAAIDHTPLGRFGEPSEIAAATAFLASDEAKFITGQIFVIDGGEITGGLASR